MRTAMMMKMMRLVVVISLLLNVFLSEEISPDTEHRENIARELHKQVDEPTKLQFNSDDSAYNSQHVDSPSSAKLELKKLLSDYEDLRRKGLMHSMFQQPKASESGPVQSRILDGAESEAPSVEEKLTTDAEVINVKVETDHALFTVDERFLSFTVDYELFYILEPWKVFNISSPRLVTLLKGLSPAVWRIGGSGSSYTYFDAKSEHLLPAKLTPNSIIFPKEALNAFAKASMESGNRFLIDLNIQTRQGLEWNPINAMSMFDFLIAHGFSKIIDFELGNEPEYDIPSRGLLQLSPTQIGEDYLILERVIRSYPEFADSRIVGPDCVGVTRGSLGASILNKVATIAGKAMRAITFHQYYFEGTKATYKNYIDPKYFPLLANTIRIAQNSVLTSKHPELPLWIGETSDSWHSGTLNVTDRYVSGFLWLEKLGLGARMGVELIMRQTFYCGNYGLVADHLQPNPDYWLSYVHKHLVGRKVLDVALNGTLFTADDGVDPPPTTRVYAHCTKLSSDGITPSYPLGSVTIFALNVSPNISKSLVLPLDWRKAPTDLYLLTPPKGDILSQQVQLNDKILELISDTQLPQLSPKTLKPGQPFSLPPLTFGFLVVPQAKAKACL